MGVHYIDFENRQGILVDDGEQPATFTLVQDLADVVAAALDYPGVWPTVGGVAGWQATSAELIRLGEKIRGMCFFFSFPTIHCEGQADGEIKNVTGGEWKIYRISKEELDKGGLTTEWCPLMQHPAIPKDRVEEFSRMATGEYMKAYPRGVWGVGDEWNRALPEFKFQDPEAFLRAYWDGKE